jgi:protein tyrosine/serine phosphatase
MLQNIIKIILKFFKVLLAIVVLWVSYFLVYGNFHQVDKNLYRSSQLFSFNLPYYIRKYEIKSILNLRNGKGKSFYNDEISISKEYNLTHYDYEISDRKIVSLNDMDKIIDLIKKAPKPILIHCKAGADRTSLVSALYLHAINHDLSASREISFIYGHFPWFGSKTFTIDESFSNFVKNNPL